MLQEETALADLGSSMQVLTGAPVWCSEHRPPPEPAVQLQDEGGTILKDNSSTFPVTYGVICILEVGGKEKAILSTCVCCYPLISPEGSFCSCRHKLVIHKYLLEQVKTEKTKPIPTLPCIPGIQPDFFQFGPHSPLIAFFLFLQLQPPL